MSEIETMLDEIADRYESETAALREERDAIRADYRDLCAKYNRWDWDEWFGYVFPTIAAALLAGMLLVAAWLFIHWAAKPGPAPSQFCAFSDGSILCRNQ